MWLCAEQAKQIWQCLAEEAVFVSDREACFKWFSKLMGDEPDLDPAINRDFFTYNILTLDPVLLTESGIKCFERFFKAVNIKENKLKQKRRTVLLDDVDLIGTEYLWKVSMKKINILNNFCFKTLIFEKFCSQNKFFVIFKLICLSKFRPFIEFF